jgi:hypothetical protein
MLSGKKTLLLGIYFCKEALFSWEWIGGEGMLNGPRHTEL